MTALAKNPPPPITVQSSRSAIVDDAESNDGSDADGDDGDGDDSGSNSDTDSDEEDNEIDCRAEMAKTWRMITTHLSEALEENMEGQMANTVRQVLTPATISMSSVFASSVMVS